MPQEIKARVPDVEKLKKRLDYLGATFVREISAVDTYFNQPAGQVLKLVEEGGESLLVHLRAKDGGFEIASKETIDNPSDARDELEQEHGVQCSLKKRRFLYECGDYIADINLIEDVGDFLILLGDAVSENDVCNLLEVGDPEFIRVPFSEL